MRELDKQLLFFIKNKIEEEYGDLISDLSVEIDTIKNIYIRFTMYEHIKLAETLSKGKNFLNASLERLTYDMQVMFPLTILPTINLCVNIVPKEINIKITL